MKYAIFWYSATAYIRLLHSSANQVLPVVTLHKYKRIIYIGNETNLKTGFMSQNVKFLLSCTSTEGSVLWGDVDECTQTTLFTCFTLDKSTDFV